MKCPRCQQDNPSSAMFCLECGAPLDATAAIGGFYAELQVENEKLRRAVAEASEQQAATSEILRVISSSPTSTQPVFETIAATALRLCNAKLCTVFRFDGKLIHLVALHQVSIEGAAAYRDAYPAPPGRAGGTHRAILTGSVVHIRDIREDPEYELRALARANDFGCVLSVPMLREGLPIGAITVGREAGRAFPDEQIQLLKIFADQAVIAIENVRLFTETKQALERQTATGEILRVISSSVNDLRPVFDTILASAAKLCGAHRGALLLFKDGLFETGAELGAPAGLAEARKAPYQPHPRTVIGRMAVERRAVYKADLLDDPLYGAREPRTVAAAEGGSRSLLAVPLLKDGDVIGAITIHRPEPGPFSDDHIALLQTFADQAVIAIENVRLFNELEARNRDLTEALERQTATAEILSVISSSPTGVQPTFDAIARSAALLCRADLSGVHRFDGELIHFAAQYGRTAEEIGAVRQAFPQRPSRASATARCILSAAVVQIADHHDDPDIVDSLRMFRTVLAVPMLRGGRPVGSISVARRVVEPFTEDQVELLETFADQAVIAIENVRLFTELQEKNRALTEALEQQTATSEVLKVISRSTFDLQPVLETLIENATKLCDAAAGTIWRCDGEVFRVGALYAATAELREVWQRGELRFGRGSSVGRAGLEGRAVQILDVLDDPEYQHLDLQRIAGVRTIVGIPMLREGVLIGAFSLWRTEVRAFTDKQIELVTTFADQAVIAMENVRLLEELRARTGELTRSVEELRALADVSRALSSTLELDGVLQTIVTRASQLAGTDACSVFEYDEATEAFHLRATNNLDEEVVTLARQTPTRRDEGVQGRMALTRQPVQVPDIAEEDAYRGPLRDVLLRTGTRAVLAVPMLHDNELIGGLTVNKRTPGAFSPEVVELLTTFATQSALAIQNARLFREIEQKSRELGAASQHKSEFLANMSHELRTPLNAIIGFSEVLSERMFGELNEKQDEYLKDIHASGRHLLSLINDILDLSKIEAGRMELEVTNFDLPVAIDNALTLVRERAARRGVALHTTVDERRGHVQGDERKIRQVLLNLLSNAIKFTPEGGRIEVGAKPVNGFIEVSVTDTGVGIAPEDQEAVFEEFRQVGTAEKKVEGTGLGLALSRKFIELHGGKIWVTSQVGQGSTFTFTVPVRPGE